MSESSLYGTDTPRTDSETDDFDTSEDELAYAAVDTKAQKARNTTSPRTSTTRSRQLINSPKPPVPKAISACLVDPFETLPIAVDGVTNQLLHFYGQDSYWQTAYALSPKIKPSIKGSWEYQAGACLTHFHILMARSALHQLRMNPKHITPATKKALEYAALQHQTKAISILRENVERGSSADLKLILTSIISLATFEQRYGEREKAVLHFRTGRDIIRQIGLQDGLHDRLREEQALWFEGIYRDAEASWMWGQEDANMRLGWLKSLLRDVDRMWRDVQLLHLKDKGPYVGDDLRLREFLFRETTGRNVSVYSDIDEFVAQQRCVLILVSIMCGVHGVLEAQGHLKVVSKMMALKVAIQAYIGMIEDLLVEHDLGEQQAEADLLWMMCQNYRDAKPRLVNAGTMMVRDALQKLDLRDCHWRASGIANVVKYLPQSRQLTLRNMLLDFISGKPYSGKVKVNEFEFSYAGV
ncbi:uncharacterized protein Z520_02519 [Fonsecaea multimorphosa CBS 102226]|uniref:Uncharacterized protein n=1 Tax=Fonsecaea multimorphosa CBS 102226 TaxID=1442371 RepID=A0A0D2HKI9_9EURO|nr:uncharacterized protein Z520_02519 [Fonsecaea multimorphosa CBS 102226]KIY02381.1 hypothetical protein Z520_02519 [Fonsecaea multimorphosa CBS 102226]OAL29023.1 hypothetical protein AYO22_02459 [Fonsecaea multimorphosa]